MLSKRKKRSLDREIEHLSDTNIIFIGIEGGDANSSREARYFDIFKEENIRFQFKIIPCYEHRSSPDQVLMHLKEEIENEPLQEGDEKWLVVDVDRYSKHLPNVAKECSDVGIELAVSNPCFEYWLLLHYQDPHEEELDECRDVKPIYKDHAEADQNNSNGYSAMFKDKAKRAVKRAKAIDDDNRWPQNNGSRVYRIIEKFV